MGKDKKEKRKSEAAAEEVKQENLDEVVNNN